jgi:hypothetical protein
MFLAVVYVCFLTIGATMATVDEPSEALLKVAKGSFHFTTSVYKVSDSCLNYGNVEQCSRPCTYLLSRVLFSSL